MYDMNECVERVLFSADTIQDIVSRLGRQISEDYKGKKLLLVSVLKGSVVFMADLMRSITIPCEIDFMVVSSYGAGTRSSGNVKIVKDLSIDVKDYDLLLVEDILDSGVTLSTLKKMREGRCPASIKICTFLINPNAERLISRLIIPARQFPTSLLSATDWIMMKNSAICLMSAC